MNDSDIGQQIKKVRMWRGYSQDRLAQAIGVDRSTISRIEHGYITPKEGDLNRIKEVLQWPTKAAINVLVNQEEDETCQDHVVTHN